MFTNRNNIPLGKQWQHTDQAYPAKPVNYLL